jgi:hypothetical protein
MGRVYDTITGLNEEGSFSFNYAYQMPPLAQGANASTLETYMSNEGAILPVYEYSKAQFPGEGSWRFTTPSLGNCRIKHQAGVGVKTAFHDLINTGNYVISFWLKVNSVGPNGTFIGIHRALTTEGGATGGNVIFAVGNMQTVAGAPYTPAIGFNTVAAGNKTFFTDENGSPIEFGKWYFVAMRSTQDAAGQRTQTFYINGQSREVVNTSIPQTNANVNQLNWGFTSAGAGNVSVNIGDWFIGSSGAISEADIQNVWNSSKPIQLPIKYYDGTTWQDPTNEQVYYDGQWNPIRANQWNGTSWVQV